MSLHDASTVHDSVATFLTGRVAVDGSALAVHLYLVPPTAQPPYLLVQSSGAPVVWAPPMGGDAMATVPAVVTVVAANARQAAVLAGATANLLTGRARGGGFKARMDDATMAFLDRRSTGSSGLQIVSGLAQWAAAFEFVVVPQTLGTVPEGTPITDPTTDLTFVQVPGPAGPAGPVGPIGPVGPAGRDGIDAPTLGGFTYTQSTPAAQWVITHNLGYDPAGIQVMDSGGEQIGGFGVTYLVPGVQLRLEYDIPLAGLARLS